jgi:phosphocarrier protein
MTEKIADAVTITHEVGLHARPSVKLTKLAKAFEATITVAAHPDGPWVDAKSIVKVMAMKAPQGSELYFEAVGGDAEAAVCALVQLVEGDFGEGNAHGANA